LTRSLREIGVIDEASVTSFEFELIGQGMGLMCLLHRNALTYDPYDDKLPASLVLRDVIPRNASGKILKNELRAPYWERQDRKV